MRIAIITESFPPDVNGVAQLRSARGGEPRPQGPPAPGHRTGAARATALPALTASSPTRWNGCPLSRCPATRPSGSACRRRAPGAPSPGTAPRWSTWPARSRSARWGARVARAVDLPMVAVYQTDLPNYARAYRLGAVDRGVRVALAARHPQRGRPHPRPVQRRPPPTCTRTACERVWLWGRGVDTERFHPARRSDAAARRARAGRRGDRRLRGPAGAREAGRPARRRSPRLPGVRLAVTGGGPMEEELRQAAARRRCSSASGTATDLARIYASLDVFVHTGPFETFGQTIQEAAASGLPVVAPAAGRPARPGATTA